MAVACNSFYFLFVNTILNLKYIHSNISLSWIFFLCINTSSGGQNIRKLESLLFTQEGNNQMVWGPVPRYLISNTKSPLLWTIPYILYQITSCTFPYAWINVFFYIWLYLKKIKELWRTNCYYQFHQMFYYMYLETAKKMYWPSKTFFTLNHLFKLKM